MTAENRVVGVVQARMGSTRLPGKMLACLGGRPVLGHVLARAKRAETLDTIVLATSNQLPDDVLVKLASDRGWPVVRGSESDVLRRVHRAATEYNADVIVRICADNPLLSPVEVDRAVRHHLDSNADYTFNHIPAKGNHYPDGFGAEVIEMSVLTVVADRATNQAHREHVTAYIWDNEPEFDVETVPAPPGLASVDAEFDLDTPADYWKLRKLFNHGPEDVASWSAEDIANTYLSLFDGE